jgi:ATP-dependent Clp protease ATP-binding subunit ClpC
MNHSFIGTEHILLGVIREGGGVGAAALKATGVSYDAAREKVEEVIGMAGALSGGTPPFTPRAKRVLELSLREAIQLNHSFIGTEHMVLGIVREGEGVATAVLIALGADPARVRQEVIRLVSGGHDDAPADAGQSPGSVDQPGSSPDRSPAAAEPRCPQCRASVALQARVRTIEVVPDADYGPGGPVVLSAVYCGRCGTTLHLFKD